MAKKAFRVFEGSMQEAFQASRAKVQIVAGGFANGKTAGAVIKALKLVKDYPGSNGLIARSTYPKLNDTVRKEFVKWCPQHWIKRFPMSANSENTCYSVNGTETNFRYVQQQGKKQENTSSNLLSATYDWIVVDQIDDPEFTHKDFLDLIGRLRGSTPYAGDDPTMPSSGPRWIIVTCNPTRGWFYKKIVRPLHAYKEHGRMTNELRQIMQAFNATTLDGLIELFEGSTYDNADNLEADYIKLLEAMYTGQMRERYLYGKWGAYEGLVYPQFDAQQHVLSHSATLDYMHKLYSQGYNIEVLEAYDHGLAVPACYGFAFVDPFGNIIICDGFYEKELTPAKIIKNIKAVRQRMLPIAPQRRVLADPQIFKRGTGAKQVVGETVASIIADNGNGIRMEPGNNEIINGIVKVQGYLNVQKFHRHPLTGDLGAPYLYVTDNLEWWIDEIDDYMWRRDTSGEHEDVPQDRNDHAMDMTKYMLSRKPKISTFLVKLAKRKERERLLTQWHEQDAPRSTNKEHRYGGRDAA